MEPPAQSRPQPPARGLRGTGQGPPRGSSPLRRTPVGLVGSRAPRESALSGETRQNRGTRRLRRKPKQESVWGCSKKPLLTFPAATLSSHGLNRFPGEAQRPSEKTGLAQVMIRL